MNKYVFTSCNEIQENQILQHLRLSIQMQRETQAALQKTRYCRPIVCIYLMVMYCARK